MTIYCSSVYQSGPFFHTRILETDRRPEIYVKSHTENIMGIRLPVLQFAHIVRPNSADKFLGLTGGGHKIQACRDRFIEYLHALIHLATLQASFYTINDALKVTSRRVHAIENITLPKFEAVLKYILRELDELEREEFTRMKLVKKHKGNVELTTKSTNEYCCLYCVIFVLCLNLFVQRNVVRVCQSYRNKSSTTQRLRSRNLKMESSERTWRVPVRKTASIKL